MTGHDALLDKLSVDAWRTVGGVTGLVDQGNTLRQPRIGLRPGAWRAPEPVVIAAGGHAQHVAQTTHGEIGPVRITSS